MIKEQVVLLQILRDFLEGKGSNYAEFEKEILKDYAKIHQVEAIVYNQIKEKEYQPQYMHQIYVAVNREKLINELCTELKPKGIRHFIVKGSEVAQFYPNPFLRSMGDTDLVVEKNKKDQVIYIMEKLNYTFEYGSYELHYNKNGFEVEIHDKLVYEKETTPLEELEFFSNFWEYEKEGHLDVDYQFIYVLTHLKKHFVNEGVGVRQFFDLAVMCKYAPLNWEWQKAAIQRLNIEKFASICLSLCAAWFGITSPLVREIDQSFLEEATDVVFKNGVFGYSSDNQKNRSIARIRNTRQTRIRYLLRQFFSVVFPSYRIMKEKYNFLERLPMLLPVAWIMRVYDCLVAKKVYKLSNVMYKSSISRKDYEKRSKMLEKWGC